MGFHFQKVTSKYLASLTNFSPWEEQNIYWRFIKPKYSCNSCAFTNTLLPLFIFAKKTLLETFREIVFVCYLLLVCFILIVYCVTEVRRELNAGIFTFARASYKTRDIFGTADIYRDNMFDACLCNWYRPIKNAQLFLIRLESRADISVRFQLPWKNRPQLGSCVIHDFDLFSHCTLLFSRHIQINFTPANNFNAQRSLNSLDVFAPTPISSIVRNFYYHKKIFLLGK